MGPIGYIVYLFPVLTAAALLYCFAWYWQATRPPVTKKIVREGPKRFSFAGTLHPMERKDALPLLVITAVYALTAFFNLGSMKAPQSALDFGNGESRTFTLAQDAYVTKLWYFPNLGTGSYNLEISSDGEHWSTLWLGTDENGVYYWADAEGYAPSYAMDQNYNQLFKWVEIKPFNAQYVRYVRITGWADKDLLELGELAFFDQDGARIPLDPEQCVLTQGDASGASINPLVDEQDTIPERLSFTNSTYFDEIYHPRTALEHIEGVYPYEISHPPLGKLILGLGIRMFGMTPFGWRFMGVLFGVLMLPLLYLFVKNLFGKTVVAACGTALLAADFMHLTQTRLATIDTYGVFFILLTHFGPSGRDALWQMRPAAGPVGAGLGAGRGLQVDGDLWLHRAGGAVLHRAVSKAPGLAGGSTPAADRLVCKDSGSVGAVLRRPSLRDLFPVLLPLRPGQGGYQPERMVQGHVGESDLHVLLSQRRHRHPPLFLPLVSVAAGHPAHPLLSGHPRRGADHPLCGLCQSGGVLGGAAGAACPGGPHRVPPVRQGAVPVRRLPVPAAALAADWAHHLCLSLLPLDSFPGAGALLCVP